MWSPNQPIARLGQASEMAQPCYGSAARRQLRGRSRAPRRRRLHRTLRTEIPPRLRDPLSGYGATSLHSNHSSSSLRGHWAPALCWRARRRRRTRALRRTGASARASCSRQRSFPGSDFADHDDDYDHGCDREHPVDAPAPNSTHDPGRVCVVSCPDPHSRSVSLWLRGSGRGRSIAPVVVGPRRTLACYRHVSRDDRMRSLNRRDLL